MKLSNLDKFVKILQENTIEQITKVSFYEKEHIDGVKDYFLHGIITDERFCHNFLKDVLQSIVMNFDRKEEIEKKRNEILKETFQL
tara:strand:+ start:814 stop:1071 length:258 start_codon:yes stop_codon:yes gene_type:complete